MSSTENMSPNSEACPGRWNHLKKVLERNGPFSHPDFVPDPQVLTFIRESCKILIVGAGGLGCELLKDIALMGFCNIDVIDMDIIDISNLNRQFLFRPKDIGESKAAVAADFINRRVTGCKVTPHFSKIQDKDDDFYRQFHIVVCGLDSIIARRWINGMLLSLLIYEDEGVLDQSTVIPLIDGGTEGFKGNARVILPGLTACLECTLDLFPPQVSYPLCTIAHTPRLPEHCIEYAKLLLWPQEKPFGGNVPPGQRYPLYPLSERGSVLVVDCDIDGDDPYHIQWIHEKSQARAREHNIEGVTHRLTQGVVKHIIPAVAATNAVIAAVCSNEVFKIATSCTGALSNYFVFNDTDGLYTYTFEAERKENCFGCSLAPKSVTMAESSSLRDLVDYLVNSAHTQMKSPAITTVVGGKNKTLYLQTVQAIYEKTKTNLPKKLIDLGLGDGCEIAVADVTTPTAIIFKLHLVSEMEQ